MYSYIDLLCSENIRMEVKEDRNSAKLRKFKFNEYHAVVLNTFSKANCLLHIFDIMNLNQYNHCIQDRDEVRAQEVGIIAILILFASAI